MIRNIVKIDEDKCNGCGLCVSACHEGAIELRNGKARLIRDDYCDGLGDCLPACPVDAITIEKREAEEYNEELVKKNMEKSVHTGGCPGSALKQFPRSESNHTAADYESKLKQWPVQIKLVPINVPYFNNADILVAADCAAYAHANFNQKFMGDKVTLIGCPKLDMTEYSEKLGEIFKANQIKSITVIRMEVPCCGGLENAVKIALSNSDKDIPLKVITISVDGHVI